MKSCFYYTHCNRCNKFRNLENFKEDDPYHDDFDSDGIRYFTCTCGNINIKLVLSNIALEDEY